MGSDVSVILNDTLGPPAAGLLVLLEVLAMMQRGDGERGWGRRRLGGVDEGARRLAVSLRERMKSGNQPRLHDL